MACGESGALNLVAAYESSSDSERDSGYTSEDDKKRKSHDDTSTQINSKKRRLELEDDSMEEAMMVDIPEYNKFQSLSLRENHNHNVGSFASSCKNNHVKTSSPSTSQLPVYSGKLIIPLPKELAGEGPSHVDDASKHQGRVRSFPHDVGNWASIVYLPLNEDTSSGVGITSYETLQALVTEAVSICQRQSLCLTPSTDFHISLSRTLLLRIHLIHPLAHDVRASLANTHRFHVFLNKFAVYVNEDKTRTFLGLKVLHGQSQLANVVAKLDRIFQTYNLPTFYEDCDLHASVAWVRGDQRAALELLLPSLESHFHDYFNYDDHLRSFHAKYIHLKAGNRVNCIQLGPYAS
ncbi:U6 snRNA phosphodiesterase 1 [Hyalella azteca]|uniref:U6 snRNA phosphodiesterase 1 n=1 Tax=Hyalella azteca TaxID=294128 RepID=A0A8B7P655_HYAAZ|nr:U6 snRNA phosphodiesterase 1 [Hyalella azteca]